jgi:tetratricopeptide (TPR) repeat protein
MLTAFRRVFQTTISMEDLRAHDAHLLDLFDWYRKEAPKAGIQTACYFEQRPVSGFTIVNAGSAHPGTGSDPIPLDESHISIAKPRDRTALVYGTGKQLLRDVVLKPAPPPRAPSDPGTVQSSVPRPREVPIPHELPPAAEHFVGRPRELNQLIVRLQNGDNTAVVGPAGLGKTALAASALREVVGKTAASLAASPYPDGVVYLDLYAMHGSAEALWESLANKLAGPDFMERSQARDRATNACTGKSFLLVIEGAEEATGKDGRLSIGDILSVLPTQNRWLVLTRDKTQATATETVELNETLPPSDAANLFDSIVGGRVPAKVREQVLDLLEGHPLALTWAGNLLARGDESADRLVSDWKASQLPALNDPKQAQHTLKWLFERSVRGLDDTAKQTLAAAGLLAHAPFPVSAIQAALGDAEPAPEEAARLALRTLVRRSLLLRNADDQWQFTHVLGYRFARTDTGSDPALRTRLGPWLYVILKDNLSQAGDPGATARLLEHLAALLRTDDDQSLWRPLAAFGLYGAQDRLTALGRLGQVRLALDAVSSWMDRIPPDKSQEPKWLRERGALASRLGNLLGDQGDLAGASDSYQVALDVTKQLAAADPSNIDRQRNLSVCHSRVGDVLRAQGNLPGALDSYEQDLRISQKLAAADPSKPNLQRDLSISHNKVGEVLQAQGNLLGALDAYQASLQIRQKLAAADPSNPTWQRDLSVSHARVGDVLRAQGHLSGALDSFQRGLQIVQSLAEADPSNTEWERDLSLSHNNVGDVLRAQGNLPEALDAYQRALQIAQSLVAADPTNTNWQRDLSFSLTRSAELQEQAGNLAEALPFAEQSLAIDERLAALDPTNANWQKDVQISRRLVARLRQALATPDDSSPEPPA